MWGGLPGPRIGVKIAPISGSVRASAPNCNFPDGFWPTWRVQTRGLRVTRAELLFRRSLWSGGACFSLPLLHLTLRLTMARHQV